MKKIFAAVLMFLLLITGCTSQREYKNNEYGFSIGYNEEWTEVQPPDGILCKIEYNGYRKDDGSAIGSVEIAARESSKEETLDNAANYYISALKDGTATYTRAMLDGLEGYWITIENTEGYTSEEDMNNPEETALIVTKNDKYAYAFFIKGADKSCFDEIEDKADSILASFKILK